MHEVQFNRPEKEKQRTYIERKRNEILETRPKINEVEYGKTG